MKVTKNENGTVVIDGEGTTRIYTKGEIIFDFPNVEFKNFIRIDESSGFYLDAISELASIKKKWWFRLFRKLGG